MNLYEIAGRGTSNRNLIKQGLRRSEGIRDEIYLDGRGILTIGVGSALAVINTSKQLVMRPLSEINARFTAAGLAPIREDEREWLASIISLPNDVKDQDGKTMREVGLAVLKDNFPLISQKITNMGINIENLLDYEIDIQIKAIDLVINDQINALKSTRPDASVANVYSKLAGNQVISLVEIGYNSPGELIGKGLVSALESGDDWAAFKEILIKSNGGTNSKDYEGVQKRRFLEAAKFSPFSGEGGKPINADGSININEIHRVLGNYDESTVNEFISYFNSRKIVLSKIESGLTENVNNFFPYRTIQEAIEAIKLTNPQLAHDLEVQLSNVARRIEKYVRSIYKSPLWTLHQVQDPDDTVKPALLPYAQEDFHLPIESTPNDPGRYVKVKDAIVEVAGATSVEYSVVYFGVVWKFETNEERREFVARRKYLWAPTSNPDTDPPDHPEELGVTVISDRMSPGDDQPIEPGSFYIDGNILHAGLTTLANGIASQQFRIRNPVVATLVDSAVARATDEVSTSVLLELDIDVAALPRDFSTRLQSGMVAGLTSLVSSMVATRLLDVIGIDGLPADVITGLVSNTASTYVVSQLGLSLAGGGAVLSLSDAFAGSLAAVPAGIIGNQILTALNIQNPTARLAGNVASAIVLASSSAGPVVAAAAMVATTVVFNVLGIGSNAGPIGIIDLETVGGRFQAGRPRTNRNGFKGPAEQLTMTVELLMNEAVPVMNAALDVIGAKAWPMSARTSLRFYLSDNEIRSYVNDNLIKYHIAGRGVVTRDFIERVFVGGNLSIPTDADPILAKVLRRGWYDWVINSVSPEYRATLPASDDLYAQHDMNVWVNRTARISTGPFRAPRAQEQEVGAPRDTEKEIIAGLISDLRQAAGNVASVLIAHIRRSVNPSHPISGLGNPTSSFENLNTAITSMIGVAALRGIDCPAMPTEISSWPTDMPAVQDGYDYLYEMLSRVRAWRDLTATALVQTSTPAVQVPARVTVAGTPDAAVQVSWQPVGVDEQVAVRWQDEGGLWSSDKVDSGASKLILPAVQPGRTYKVQAQRLAAPVSGERRASDWPPLQSVTVPTGLEGARVARLELSQQGTDTTWEGRDVQINWSGMFPAVAGGSAAFANSAVPATSPHMQGYGIRILTADGRLLREVGPVLETGYTYRYEDNLADSRAKGLPSASRALRFEVSILPKVGPAVGMQALSVTNDAPPKVEVMANAGVGLLSVEVTPVADLDLDGYAIWISDQPGFDPASLAPTYRGPSPHLVQRNLVLGAWYIRAAAVDLFQPREGLDVAGLNLSDEVVVDLADITVDQVPPAVPTGLVLSSTAAIANSGETISTLTAKWNRNDEEDFLLYEIQMRRSDSEIWLTSLTGLPEQGMPAFNWSVLPNIAYTVRIRAADRSGNRSEYCIPVQQVSARDLDPPAAPTGFSVSAGARTISLRWTNPADADWFETEIWIAAVEQLPGNPPAVAPNEPPANGLATTVTTDSWVFAAPSRDTRYHFWVRAKDTSGNLSPYTGPLSCTTPLITTADFTAGSIDANILMAGTVTAGLLEVASRAITVENLVFEPNSPSENRVRWKVVAGASPRVIYKAVDNAGAEVERNLTLTEGSAEWTGGVLYLYIVDPLDNSAVNVQSTGNYAAASGSGKLILATYAGGTRLIVTHGATVITGDMIQTNAIKAGHIEAGAITASAVRIGGTDDATLASLLSDDMTTIDGGKIKTGSIDASSLKVKSRIISISGLNISFNGTKVGWSASILKWTSDVGEAFDTMLPADEKEAPIGQRLRLYWEPGAAALILTANSSINPPAAASILATIQRGALVDPIRLHHQDVLIKGNNITAGAVDANIIRTDLLDAREVRMGVTVDGEAGIYMRTTDNGNVVRADGSIEEGAREGQRTIFATSVYQDAQGRPNAVRRAQLFVSADGSDAGFEAWNAAGVKIFDSNGLRPGTVGTDVLRPESATFVRTCRGDWSRNNAKDIRVTFEIKGLRFSEQATVVLMAFSNGHDNARTNPQENTNRPDSYRMRIRKIGSNPDTNPDLDEKLGGVWLDGNLLMYYQDSVKLGNGIYSYYVHYNLVADAQYNPDLLAASDYTPFTSITALVSMR